MVISYFGETGRTEVRYCLVAPDNTWLRTKFIDHGTSLRSDLTCVLSWHSRAETAKRTGPHSLRSPQISRFALMSGRCWVCKQVGRYRCTRWCAAPNLPKVLPIRAV